MKRLEDALHYIRNESDENAGKAVADVLSGRLPENLLKERAVLNISRKRKHVGVGPYIPEKTSSRSQKCTLQELVGSCLEQEVTCESWMSLLKNDVGQVFRILKKMTASERNVFLGKFEEAKCIWLCTVCDKIDPNLSYTYCELCCSAYHWDCAGMTQCPEAWLCPDCYKK